MISTREVGNVIATTRLGQVAPVGGAEAGRPVAGAAAPAQDGVELPGTQVVAGMLSALRALPDVRGPTVARVGARLRAGVQPPARDVARQMLSRSVGDHMGAGN